MSFQDVKPSASRKPGEKRGLLQSYRGPPTISEQDDQEQHSVLGMGYSALSDDILAYRRHVDLLRKMAASLGTADETAATQTQLRLQTDVIAQLGDKIESRLEAAERSMATSATASTAQSRATHAKLTRDYRRVETVFKNVQMDVKKRKGLAEARLREERENAERAKFAEDTQEEAKRMQMQLQEDVSVCRCFLFA